MGSAKDVWNKSMFSEKNEKGENEFSQAGVFTDSKTSEFIKGIEKHRFWEREEML